MNARLVTRLTKDFETLLDLLDGTEKAHFNTSPFEGSWSPAQLGEHLLKSYKAIGILNGPTEKPNRPVDEKLAGIDKIFSDYSTKLNAPKELVPSDGPIEKEWLMGKLKNHTDTLVSFAGSHDLELLCLAAELPRTGHLTRFEWLSFIGTHTERHIHQLKNIIRKLN